MFQLPGMTASVVEYPVMNPLQRIAICSFVFLLPCLACSCGGRSGSRAGHTALNNTANQPGPAESDEIDEEGIPEALEEASRKKHFTDVTALDHVVLRTRDGKHLRAFFLYAYGGFDAWQGERKAEGELDAIVAELTAEQEACQQEYRDAVAAVEGEVARLRKLIETTDDPDERAALAGDLESAEMEEQAVGETEPECPGWDTHYPGAELSSMCAPDQFVLAAYDVRRVGTPARIELTPVQEEEWTGCGLADEGFSGNLRAGDFDQDGATEVLLAWAHTASYQEYTRGEHEIVSAGTEVQVFREDLSVQGRWHSEIVPAPDSDQDQSGRILSWFEDRNNDGHDELLRREIIFRPGCRCDQPAFEQERKLSAWHEQVADGWSLEQTHCEKSGDASCTLESDQEYVATYDPARDAWQ